jgi:hypothetical protein
MACAELVGLDGNVFVISAAIPKKEIGPADIFAYNSTLHNFDLPDIWY